MKRAPYLWPIVKLIQEIANPTAQANYGGMCLPARPHGYPSFGHRIAMAWLVFTGRADVLVWPDPHD